jgi:hypothetical protein
MMGGEKRLIGSPASRPTCFFLQVGFTQPDRVQLARVAAEEPTWRAPVL